MVLNLDVAGRFMYHISTVTPSSMVLNLDVAGRFMYLGFKYLRKNQLDWEEARSRLRTTSEKDQLLLKTARVVQRGTLEYLRQVGVQTEPWLPKGLLRTFSIAGGVMEECSRAPTL